jgi:hypothetical protein
MAIVVYILLVWLAAGNSSLLLVWLTTCLRRLLLVLAAGNSSILLVWLVAGSSSLRQLWQDAAGSTTGWLLAVL